MYRESSRQSYQSRSSIRSNGMLQSNKMPTVVRFSFINRSNSLPEQNQNKIISLVRRSAFGKQCTLCQNRLQETQFDCVADCGHKFCISCLHSYFTYKLNVMEELTCPEQGCLKTIDPKSLCFERIPIELKQKYHKLQLWKQTISNPNLRLCSQQHCDGIIDITKQKYACPVCKIETCKQCMLKKHQGPCDINFQHNFADWKRCPNCKMFIQKNQGCNHITCRCSHQFCYVCLSNWSEEHYQCGSDNMHDFQFNSILIPREVILDMSMFPRILLGLLMVILIPVFIVLSIVALVLALAFSILIGSLCAPCIVQKNLDCPICLYICLFPFLAIGGVLTGIFLTFYYGGIAFIEIAYRYFRTIKAFWYMQPRDQDQNMHGLQFNNQILVL